MTFAETIAAFVIESHVEGAIALTQTITCGAFKISISFRVFKKRARRLLASRVIEGAGSSHCGDSARQFSGWWKPLGPGQFPMFPETDADFSFYAAAEMPPALDQAGLARNHLALPVKCVDRFTWRNQWRCFTGG